MSSQAIHVRRMTGGCGAEVLGVDLAGPIGNSQWEVIRDAFHEHGVVFFRDQNLTPEQHIAFANRWGPIDINRFFRSIEGYREIAIVDKGEFDKANIGGDWHADHSYDEAPAMGSILVARQLPDEGGDTLFANMYAAYETLSSGLKQTLAGLRAIHSAAHVFGPNGLASQNREGKIVHRNVELAEGEVSHPVVVKHPMSGKPALYVNPIFTLRFEGWSAEESRPLLDYLYRRSTRPELTCRFRWAPGSVAFWDNRAVWHYAANDYHGHRRLMHRITVRGTKLSPLHSDAASSELAR
ncbi:MAG: taurine dioxygenase [Hyphomicrobiales bacterium]|nr:taurine dioxygenase [Hyphomicrobiales bacterium]